jgi:hypothetical protein
MSISSSKHKTEFLAMPHGTATNRLRKMILFNLVQRCNEDTCFKCGKKILTVEELSIEHKKPWEGISVELFWDLNNIAFSHLRCNKPHSYGNNKKVGPEGTDWCSGHKAFLPSEDFWKSKRYVRGVLPYCKVCHQYNNKENNRKKNGAGSSEEERRSVEP